MIEENQPQTQPESDQIACEMCKNYERQLVQSQKQLKEEQDRMKEELNKEAALRQDLEKQWQEKRDEHKEEVQLLKKQLKDSESNFEQLQKNFNDSKVDISNELMRLTDEREFVHRHLEMLQRDNDILSGKYIEHSQILQNQEINLPNTVEELQERLLNNTENLIEAKIGCEHAEQEMVALRDETQLLRAQIKDQNYEAKNKIQHLE